MNWDDWEEHWDDAVVAEEDDYCDDCGDLIPSGTVWDGITCQACADRDGDRVPCCRCHGGWVSVVDLSATGFERRSVQCGECGGTGYVT